MKRHVVCAECGREEEVEIDLPDGIPEEWAEEMARPERPFGQYCVCEECLKRR